jgi:hypothetical protein
MKLYKNWKPTQHDSAGLGCEEQQDWFVLPVMRTRDSGPFDQSNFAVALERLGGESDTCQVHRFSHWGPGWFEIILLHPDREAEGQAIEDALDSYPILDEMDLGVRESDCAWESWLAYGAADFVRELARVYELNEDTVSWLQGQHEALWSFHSDHAPITYESEDDGASFSFRYVEHASGPSRSDLARFICDTRTEARAKKSAA